MAIEFQCECGAKLEPFVTGNIVSVPKCQACWDTAFEEGAASREDEIASLQSDLLNMVEQNRILQEQLDYTDSPS